MWDWLTSKRATPYWFMAPVMVLGVAFFVAPLIFAAYISFTDWDGVSQAHWVGLTNYEYLFTRDPFFLTSVAKTFYFAGGSVLVGVPAALVIAVLIHRSRWQAFWRTIYWLPMITNIVAVAFIWWFILNDTSGLVNRALDLLHLPGPMWLTSPRMAMVSVVIVAAWMTLGQNVLLYLTGLNDIDECYYEAGRLDGATPLQLFWHVTIPMLRPTTLFVMITSLISALSSFVLMLVLTSGGPVQSTTVTGLYIYNMAFTDLRLGRASAGAYVLFAIIFAISLIQLRVMRRGGVEAH